jgi:hypothetical protein
LLHKYSLRNPSKSQQQEGRMEGEEEREQGEEGGRERGEGEERTERYI